MAIELSDINAARELLHGVIVRTPVVPDNDLTAKIGCKVFHKAECLQRSGSCKIRGAYNKISKLSAAEKEKGVVAASAGNHAQGVALAASLNEIASTIVLPEFGH